MKQHRAFLSTASVVLREELSTTAEQEQQQERTTTTHRPRPIYVSATRQVRSLIGCVVFVLAGWLSLDATAIAAVECVANQLQIPKLNN